MNAHHHIWSSSHQILLLYNVLCSAPNILIVFLSNRIMFYVSPIKCYLFAWCSYQNLLFCKISLWNLMFFGLVSSLSPIILWFSHRILSFVLDFPWNSLLLVTFLLTPIISDYFLNKIYPSRWASDKSYYCMLTS